MTITDVIIETLDGKWTGVWMTSCPEAMVWEFWWFLKKAVSWDLSLSEASWHSDLGEASPVVVNGMRSAFVGSVSWDWTLGRPVQLGSWLKDDVGTVSIVKIVSCRKTKSKKKVKRLVPELKKVVSASGFPCNYIFHISVYLYSCIMAMPHTHTHTHTHIYIYIYIYILRKNQRLVNLGL